jgi:hypothetical protein
MLSPNVHARQLCLLSNRFELCPGVVRIEFYPSIEQLPEGAFAPLFTGSLDVVSK